jgi:hypothetical protein
MPAQFLLQCVDAPKLVIEPPVRKAAFGCAQDLLRGLIRNAESVVFVSNSPLNKLAQNSKRNHNHGMRMENRFSRLRGASVRCASVVLAFTFCASAFAADPSKNVVLPAQPRRVMKTANKMCYTFTTTSGIPVPCARVSGIPTTASPMTIYINPAIR